MTNGERIQTILDVDRDCTEVHGENGTMTFTVTQDFWNAEYKEPTTKNDLGVDAISRQAVIDLMMQKWGENFSGDDAMQESIDAVRVMPTVTPQQRTGRWIKVIDEIDSLGNKTWHHECSICKSNKSGWGNHKFCPDCGAKMEEAEE